MTGEESAPGLDRLAAPTLADRDRPRTIAEREITMTISILRGAAACTLALLLASAAWAANEGQADLDKATEAKLGAESLADLEKVAGLCESALKKGLDEENTAFANQLLSSVLLQHAQKLASAIFDQVPPDRRWQ